MRCANERLRWSQHPRCIGHVLTSRVRACVFFFYTHAGVRDWKNQTDGGTYLVNNGF